MASRFTLTNLAGDRDDRGRAAVHRLGIALAADGLMRSSGGTGDAAAQQQPDDAAMLLIGLATHEPPASVARHTRAHAGAVARGANVMAVADVDCPAFRGVAQQETFGEAVAALVKLAPRFFWRNVQLFQALRPGADADAAMTAAANGLVRDIRCTVFRPGGAACIRLVDSTQGTPINRAVIWFDGARVYPAPAKGVGISGTGEFGCSLVLPLAFAILGDDRDKDREAGLVSPPTGSAGAEPRANARAVRATSVQGAQRRETVQAATFAEASADD